MSCTKLKYMDVYTEGHMSRKGWDQDSGPFQHLFEARFSCCGQWDAWVCLEQWPKILEAAEVSENLCLGWGALVTSPSAMASCEPPLNRPFKETHLWHLFWQWLNVKRIRNADVSIGISVLSSHYLTEHLGWTFPPWYWNLELFQSSAFE